MWEGFNLCVRLKLRNEIWNSEVAQGQIIYGSQWKSVDQASELPM